MSAGDANFSTVVAEFYDRHLGAPFFAPHARSIAARLADIAEGELLELAAGTGVATRVLAEALPGVSITATDLNLPMLALAERKPELGRVRFRQADAMALPFADEAFDAVACQFGVMFFPDRRHAYGEVRRVLRGGGRFVFNVWDRIGETPVVAVAERALGERYPGDPPRFMSRTPYGYHDAGVIRADLAASGFEAVAIEGVDAVWRVASVGDAAVALCQGTPLRGEIEAREAGGLEGATGQVAGALERAFGPGAVELRTRSLVVSAQRG